MSTVLVVDGSDVCGAPIVAFVLGKHFATSAGERLGRRDAGALGGTGRDDVRERVGASGMVEAAIAFYGVHRATPLTVDDIADSALVLMAERAQRSAVVRMRPGTQARVFTWEEALVLGRVLADRVRNGVANPPADLPALAAALHEARVPLIEPPVRTGVFH